MNNLNQQESPWLYWFSKIGDFCALSVMWILLCLPIITVIPASIALYDSIVHCVHGTDEGSVGRFFRTLKSELRRGVILDIVWGTIAFTLIYGYSILYQVGLVSSAIATFSLIYLISMLIPLAVLTWLIPVEARFQHSFFGLFRSSAIYAICHLPTTIALLVILAIAVVLVLFIPILALLMPAIVVTIQCWFVERVFKNYIPQEKVNDNDI